MTPGRRLLIRVTSVLLIAYAVAVLAYTGSFR